MLSILIPTYNYDCTHLVKDLQQQAEQIGINYEIIVADDASPITIYRERNREIYTLPHCRFIELPENVGRARIRNRLADEAQYTWLLFMDADAEVISPTFIIKYLHAITDTTSVICGGLCHADNLPSPEVSLRYAYEKRADKQRAAYYRKKSPYAHFITFCFMVRSDIFHAIRFDESITEYGHEDTLFGIELERKKVNICHIDNPMQQGGIETNEEFLDKTHASIRNLAQKEETFLSHSMLIKTYRFLHRLRITKLLARYYANHGTSLISHLCSKRPHLGLFFLYKLAYYCHVKDEEK